MAFTPFSIYCTTCEAKLTVRGSALLGQLLACPRCGSMVQIPNQKSNQTLAARLDSVEVTPPAPPIAPIVPIAEVLPALPALPTSEESAEPLIQKRHRLASKNSTRMILSIVLLSIVFLLGTLYIAVLLRSSSEKSPQPQLPAPPQIIVEPLKPPEDNFYQEGQDEEELTPKINEFDDPIEEVEPKNLISLVEEEKIIDEEPFALPSIEPDPPLEPQPIRERIAIDVSERLKLPIAGLRTESATLYDAATVLAEYAGVPLTWDVPGMRLFGISLEKPLRLDFGESTVGEVLESLLSQNQLAMLIEYEQIFVYPIAAADPTLREERYEIVDLGESSQMIKMIPDLIAPFSWKSLGGAGSLDTDGTTLIVNQTEMNHKEITRFLEMVRRARNIPLLSTAGMSPQETERVERELFPERYCEATLDKSLSLHYITPTPLADIFRILGPELNLRFLVNHRALNGAYVPLTKLKGIVRVEKGTVREAIGQLLHSVDQVELTYRIVDWNTVEIITRDAALLPEYESLESHHYGVTLRRQAALTAEEMITMFKNTIEPNSWAEMTFGGGVVLLDHVSETFFIRQSQPVQRIMYEWLSINTSQDTSNGF